MSLTDVTRELLVRYLGTWAPGALHGGRRATFALVSRAPAGVAAAEAALRVFAEFADRLRGRELTMIVAGPDADRDRLAELQRELGTPAALTVHPLAGDGPALLPVALRAARAAGAPLLVALDGIADEAALRAVRAGRPAEVLLITEDPAGVRDRVRAAGFALGAAVELVDADGRALLACLGTGSAKSLEAFKTELWAVDEYAGVRLRDPHDPDGRLLDISLTPNPAPLRRELLAYLDRAGPSTVTALKHVTMTETVYRPADTVRALHGLLDAGAVTRDPAHGRLGGDVVITRT
ncbi:hypothetical protein [Catenuloplanes atrovinosus]|uniref:Uncharacterized protein n=1 Tax=Catenuloplanes atrovinosus TaxID=137266 RepID=A0AAE3YLY0_9ACTN|nr:hypothetical protein [Catenuloplanes atrovinosus]MDR7274937.1 hypothetical protein [Catenuloplanes atrovinosus]